MIPFARSGCVASLLPVLCLAQTPLPAGKGSFASFPPPEAGASVDSFERLSRIDVLPGETRPIPTNDWWTQVVVAPFAGDLWAQPLVVAPSAKGVSFWYPVQPAADGNGMDRGNAIVVSGSGFSPTRDLAKDWGDWHVVVRLEDGSKHLDMTLVRGEPIVWCEVSGFQPTLALPAGAKATTDSGRSLPSTPTALDRFLVLDGTKAVGVHLPLGSRASLQDGVVTLALPAGHEWFSLSGLPRQEDLGTWRQWATTVPRRTRVDWSRTGTARLRVRYAATGQDLTGSGNTDLLQTFPPHAWRQTSASPAWRAETWRCPRGLLKAATGSVFTFEYDLPGIVPDYGPADPDPAGEPTPWNRTVQDSLVTAYLAKATYGDDTYWGGKDLVLLAKHAVMAARTGHPQAGALLAKARAALVDWLTWTPGEKAHYFAWYPRWKALVGFQSSYGSEQFTDNHFHYGYLVHAAALVGSLDPRFLSDYGPAIERVAQQYANWDRSDTSLPFLRTFEPWTGHSYAGGTSSPGGNNQESTSEAMQSWVGLFLLGSALGDTAMRDAGSFGYLMESRATLEYWFDWKKENFAPGWKHANAGIVFDGGQVYGTWFSGNPLHIHAIQYLPICPGFDYLVRDTAWARREYRSMYQEAAADQGYTDESGFGDDWANVALSFEQLFDPRAVCAKYAKDRAAKVGWTSELNAGVTYSYAHANRQLGPVAQDLSYSLPSAVGFRDAAGRLTHVVWNPSETEATCDVFQAGKLLGTLRVPARTVVRHRMDAKPVRIELTAPRTLPVGTATQISMRGLDQYGASIDPGTVAWTATSGTIDAQGRFTCAKATDSVTIAAAARGVSGSITVRVGNAPKLTRLAIHPSYLQMVAGETRPLQAVGLDQYGDTATLGTVSWTSRGAISVDSRGTALAVAAGSSWVRAESQGMADSVRIDVYTKLLELVDKGTCTASSSLGANGAAKACDGDPRTRWESGHGVDPQWIQVELDTVRELVEVAMDWENAAASRYQVQVSMDARNWSTWAEVSGGDGKTDSLRGGKPAKFVRVLGLARTTAYGYSLWELRLRGFPRTDLSALGDADSLAGPSNVRRTGVRNPHQGIHLGGRTFSVSLAEGESIVSCRLRDLQGRDISGAEGRSGTAILQVATSRRQFARPVLLAP